MYKGLDDRYNVRIGPKYVNEQFFGMTSINGAPTVPRFDLSRGDCDASIVNASEGALYNSQLTHDSVLWYWRKALCRKAPLHFTQEVQKGWLRAYEYVLRPNVYDRFNDTEKDCYKGFMQTLPDGLTDVSKCYYGKNFLQFSQNYLFIESTSNHHHFRHSIGCITPAFLWP